MSDSGDESGDEPVYSEHSRPRKGFSLRQFENQEAESDGGASTHSDEEEDENVDDEENEEDRQFLNDEE